MDLNFFNTFAFWIKDCNLHVEFILFFLNSIHINSNELLGLLICSENTVELSFVSSTVHVGLHVYVMCIVKQTRLKLDVG